MLYLDLEDIKQNKSNKKEKKKKRRKKEEGESPTPFVESPLCASVLTGANSEVIWKDFVGICCTRALSVHHTLHTG